jgi:excisionase family DNA binding protein
MSDTEYYELPEMPGYISTEQAAKILGISKQRVYQYVGEKRLQAYRVGSIILLPIEAVKQFKPNITGRPRKKATLWRVYRDDTAVLATEIEVQIRTGRQDRLIEQLKAIFKNQRHTFPGTIQRFVFKDNSPLTTITILLVWKETEMPDAATREQALAAFKAELADVLDWETARYATKEGIIYT